MSAARNSRSRQLFLLSAAVAIALTVTARRAPQASATYEVVHAFSGETSTARAALVQAPNGKIYGTTWRGGQYGRGTIFEADRQADGSLTVTTVHEFSGPDGTELYGDLVVGPDGRLYGTAASGGATNWGTVFAFDPATASLQVLRSMDQTTTGLYMGLVSGSDGALYGVTDTNRIFKITTDGDFTVLATLSASTHGRNPRGPLFEGLDGDLYGTASAGGPDGFGTVFRVTKTGVLSRVCAFTSTTGQPWTGVTQASDGVFYGTTLNGGSFGSGVLFSVDTAGTFAVLHNFTNVTGSGPEARPIEAADGLLYGTTRGGGTSNRGVVYRIGKGGAPGYGVVQSITSQMQNPEARLMQTTFGDFYGTTTEVGSSLGAIFRVPATLDTLSRVHAFPRSAIRRPVGALVQAADGAIYGATSQGGPDNWGTLFRLEASGAVTVLRPFAFPTGAQPASGPILGADGKLYGTTQLSGSSGVGAIYRMNVDGTGYTVLHSFSNATGSSPTARLTLASDGNIYGTTVLGGPSQYGSIFRIAPGGAVSTVHYFSGGAAGSRPYSEVLQASDGFMYGTTSGEGSGTQGTIYRIDLAGTVTTLHVFSGTDGSGLRAGLTEGPDGNLYGVAAGGGTASSGVLFRITPAGVFTKIADFNHPTRGSSPRATLLRSRDGRLYGVTAFGGAHSGGTLFRLNSSTGQLSILHNFDATSLPSAMLLEPAGENGLLGSTQEAGPKSGGVIFRFTPDRPPVGTADSFTVAEDTPLTIAAPGVLGNDLDDGGPLSATLVSPTPVSHGNVALNSDGSFTFTPAQDFHGNTSFTYKVSDAFDESDPVTVTLVVTAVNDAPTVANASVSTDEDTTTAGVVGWSDVDDTAVTFRIGANGARGTATVDANSGAFTYTPNANAHGTDSFTVIANDGDVDSSPATITVVINPVNDAPLAAPQSVTTAEDVSRLVALAGTDVDGDPLTFVILMQPLKGTATLAGNGATYLPLANFHGADSFTFSVSDGQLSSAAVVTVTVTASNDAPIAAPQTVSTVEDRPVALTLWGSDLDGDSVTYTILSGPANGSLSGTAPDLVYTPAQNFRGGDSFLFRVSDGTADSPLATVNINVIGEQFVLASPEVSAVQTIAVSPVNPSVLYAGAQRGFFRSTDGGASWHRGDVKFEVSSIAVHPTTPTTVFSAGFDFGSVRRSTDGGATWQSLNAPSARRVILDPSRPNTIYTFGSGTNAVSRSTDAGATWVLRSSGLAAQGTAQVIVQGAAIDPAVPSRLFVSLANGGGVFRSVDSADSWQRVGFLGMNADDVKVDPRGNGIVYAAVNGRVQKSLNAGDSWADVNGGIVGSAGRLAIDSVGTVYATTAQGQLWVSSNGGSSWVRHLNALPQTTIAAIALDPTQPDVLYVASRFNLYKSTNGSQTFTQSDAGIVSLSPWAMLVSRSDPQVVYAATNAGVFKSADAGSSWNLSLDVVSQSLGALAQDPLNPNTVYMGEANGLRVHRTLDGGATWTAHSSGLGVNVFSLAVDGSGTVYAGGNGGVYRSIDDGVTWAQAGTGLSSATVHALAPSATPGVLYAGTSSGLYRTIDGAATWQPLTSGLPSGFIRSIAVDPSDASTVYAVVLTGTFGVYKSIDGGDSWTRLNLSLGSSGFIAVVVDPATPSTVYAATTGGQGLARSLNGGTTWQTMTTGLPNTEIVSLAVGSDSSLYAGLLAAGVWKYARATNDGPLAQSQSVTTAEDTPAGITLTGTDPDGDALTFAIVAGPSHGTLSGTAPNLTYTPAPNYHGPDSFTFRANDGQVDSNVATVSITLNSVNDPPVAQAGTLSLDEDTSAPLTLAAADADGDTLVYSIVSGPAHGTMTGSAANYTYTPAANYHGPDAVTFRATDPTGASSEATITITVAPVNDAPVAVSQSIQTLEDVTVGVPIAATDVDGDQLFYSFTVTPRFGSLQAAVPAPNVSYMPRPHFHGTDRFEFVVSDGTTTSTAIVNLTITPVNDAPTAHSQQVLVVEDLPRTIALAGTDRDGDTLTYAIAQPPAHGTLTGTAPNLVYTPVGNYNGPDSFSFTVSDGSLASTPATVTVSISTAAWMSTGSEGGRMARIVIDPSNPDIVYATTQTTGIFKSTDGGSTWKTINAGLPVSPGRLDLSVEDLAIAPSSPDVLYAAMIGGGVFKSTNGGGSWTSMSSGIWNDSALEIVVDPFNANIAYAGGFGVYRTTDGGASWSPINTGLTGVATPGTSGSGIAPVLEMDPVNANVLYVGTLDGLFKTTTAGASWTLIQATPSGAVVPRALAISPQNGNQLHIAYFFSGHVYRSTDAGNSWTLTNQGVTGRSISRLRFKADGSVLYGTTSKDVYRSIDGGVSWSFASTVSPSALAHDLATDEIRGALFAGTLGNGVFRSSDDGATWQHVSTGLRSPQTAVVKADPTTPGVLFAGTEGTGVAWSVDTGASWAPRAQGIDRTSVSDVAVDPGNPNRIYITTNTGFMRSMDRGLTWQAVGGGLPGSVTVVEPDPVGTGTVYVGTALSGMFKSSDGGTSFTAINSGLSNARVWRVATVPTQPSTLLIATTAGMFKTVDAGASWIPASTGLPADVRGVAVSSGAAPMAYAVTAAGVFGSGDLGATWQTLGLTTEFLNAVAIDPQRRSRVAVAGTNGVWTSDDEGATWRRLTTGLGGRPAGLAFSGGHLFVATSGGVFELVEAANDAPVAQGQSVTTAEDTPKTVTLGATDADGQPLTYAIGTSASHGTITITGATVTYTPAPNYHGADSFTFTASDGTDSSNVATVSITVTSVNDTPAAVNATLAVDEDMSAALTVTASDADEDVLTFTILNGPSHGTLTGVAPNYTYLPNANYHGPDAVTFRATDPSGASSDATISITIRSINDAPVAVPQLLSTGEDTPLAVVLGGSDVDGDALSFGIAAAPLKGTLSGSGAMRTYTPLANFRGTDTFTFTVTDGTASSSAVVTITVTPSNDAPIAATQAVSTVEDTPVAITLWGSDLDGDPVTFTIVSGVSNGALAGTVPNLTYAPAENYRGSDSFTFKVNDGTIDSPAATVTITVTGEQFVRVSPDAGGIAQTIAVSAVNSAVVYAGTARGFYRSTDSGASWTRASFGSHFSSIAIHPTTPTTLFAAGFQSVWRSVDGGANWTSLNGPGIAAGVVVDPSNPQILYTRAFSQFALMKSTDGGATWAARTTGMIVRPGDQLSVSTLAVDASNPSRLFAGLSGPNGLFRTTDGATTWQASGLAGMSVNVVVVDALAPSVVYAIANGRLHRSVDGGTNWVDINGGISGFPSLLTVEPATGVVYAAVADAGIFASANQGASWTRFDLPQTGALASMVSDPQHAGRLYLATQLGVFKSTNGAQTWSRSDDGMTTLTAYAMVGNHADGNVLFAATDGGVFKTENAGGSWDLSLDVRSSQFQPASLIQDPLTSSTFYLATNNAPGVYRTTDAGSSWSLRTTGFPANAVVRMLATDRQTGAVFAGIQGGGLYVSVDSGTTWSSLAGSPTSLSAMAISYSAPSTIYVGTFSNGLHRSTDGGATWVQQSSGLPGAVMTLAVHPANSSIAYAGSGSGGLFKTTNGGAVWTALSMSGLGTSSVTQIVTDPNNPEHVYLALVSGVARSTDGGATWQLLTAGLATREMFRIALASDSTLYAAPFSDGIWKYLAAANDPPLAQSQSVTTAEDTSIGVTLIATDPDAEPLTFSIGTMPLHGTLSASGANVTYTPAPNYNGPDSFTFVANDGQANSAPATVSITVSPVNDAPVAQADAVTTDEDTPITISAAALVGNDTDVDGDGLTVQVITPPAVGTLSSGPAGLTYTPPANFFGEVTFTYQAHDGALPSNAATVTITVLPVNDAPVALHGSLTVDEDTTGNGTVAATDIDTPLLTYAIHTNGGKGTAAVTDPNSGAFTYTPSANANGTDSFVVAVTDGQYTVHATVIVTIDPVNDAPVAADASLSTDEDVAAGGTLTATDVESTALTYSIVANGSKGTVVIVDAAAGTFVYTPNADANGTDTFTFRASDGTLQSDVAIVHITIASVNDAPVAQPISMAAPKQTPTAGQLIATDVDGDALSFAVVQPPTQGTVAVAPDGSFTYTSSASAGGIDTFTFKANDGSLDSVSVTASITILSATGAPVAFDATLSAMEDTAVSGTLTSAAQAGRVLTYSIAAAPSKGAVVVTNASTGAFTYTPAANENGDDSFTFRVSDGVQSSNLATISIAIAAVNDAPVATPGSLAVTEDRSESGILIGSDVDGQALTFELVAPPTRGTVVITNAATGRYTYTPNPDAIGADTFSFRVTDGVTEATAVVSVAISNLNDGPVAEDVSFTTTVDTPLTATLPASDPDNDPLTFEVRRTPRNGTVTIVNAATGAFIYTPAAGFSGTDTFTFRVSDGTRTSLLATVTITVRPN